MAPFLFALACGRSGGGGAAETPATPDTAGAVAPAPVPETAPAPPPADTAAAAAQGPESAAGTTPAAPSARGQTDWMRVDEASKTVQMDIVAGLTGVNGSLNFNGHANGKMTVTVPAGWTVVMNFSSRDANVPHSLFITDKAPPYPSVMTDEPAIPRAYSINLQQGIGIGKNDVLRFPVEKLGRYFMACGVPGHAASGMWGHFVVAANAPRPTVEVKA